MTAIDDKYCIELEKLKSAYLQQLVNTHEEVFTLEARIEEIISEMVEMRRQIVTLLRIPQAERPATYEWQMSLVEYQNKKESLDAEIVEAGNRLSELHFRIGAYERLIAIMEEKIAACRRGVS